MKYHLSLLLLRNFVHAQQTLDISNKEALKIANNQATTRLTGYYVPNHSGAIPSNGASDATGIQWYECGIMWEAVLRTAQVTGDASNVGVAISALVNSAFGPHADLLGPPAFQALSETVLGKWNDDIGWWGMGPITGAELFAPDTVMPGGDTFFKLAKTTHDQIWLSWDDNTCRGGIFWTRNRKAAVPNEANYKSVITNAQFIASASRLYILSQNRTFVDQAERVWRWLRDSQLVDAEGNIWDGANAPNCDNINKYVPESYKYGQIIEGLALLYTVTSNQVYLDNAELYARKAFELYTLNNVVRDLCEPNCPLNRVSAKGILLRGYAALYKSGRPDIKARIREIIAASVQGLVKTCDSRWNCGNNWGPEGTVYSDFHTQLNTVELLNAATSIFAPPEKSVKFSLEGEKPPAPAPTPTKSGQLGQYSLSLIGAVLIGYGILNLFN